MLETYQTEIIATIIILTLLIIYFLIKKKQIKNTLRTEKDALKEIIIDNVIDTPEVTSTEDIKKTKHKSLIKKIHSKKSTTQKREVPSYGKITKESFKEFSGKRILVAEDNLINQKVIAGLLAGSGIELVMANNGKEALDILEKDHNFTIVLMDAHMPIIDGFETTKAIRENAKYNHIVVVALSGDTAADDVKKMAAAGMQEHLEKPLKMANLYNILYAYTGLQKQTNKDTYVEVIITKELNGDKGLNICGGDEVFYLEILNEFMQAYSNSSDKLTTLMQSNKVNEADRLLLDIIGITANIGADALEDIAKNLKIAIKNTEDKSYQIVLEQYTLHLHALLIDIEEYKNL